MSLNNKIVILLSTYNGKNYLIDQLDSLLSQSYKNVKLLVRDDGSIDRTKEILSSYKNYNIDLLGPEVTLGIKKSFDFLLRKALESDADYFMFCDQDDVWKRDKVKKTLAKMKQLEMLLPDAPLLVHTDLHVVDENLNLLHKSFWHYQHIDPTKNSFNRLLMQNVVTGCTIMINRKLALLSLPIPKEAIMHDWWIALVAAQFGLIDYIEDQTILYRQHIKNNTGAKKFDLKFIFNYIKNFHNIKFDKHIAQAKAFLERFKNQLDDQTVQLLEDFISIKQKTLFQRKKLVFKHKLFKQGIIRNIALILKI